MKKLVMLSVLTLTATVSFAQSAKTLADTLVQKGIITAQEAAQITAQSKKEAAPAWVKNLTVSGDVRVRTQIDHAASKTQIRERLRVRFGLETALADNVKAAIGIATGESVNGADKSPTSTNHTFNAFNKSAIFLDFAYLTWQPAKFATLSAGKVKGKMAFWAPTDLVWDTDINPDGAALTLTKKTDNLQLFANAGFYTLGEQADADHRMPAIYIVQPGAEYKSGNFSIKGALAYQYFSIKDKAIKTNDSKWLGVSPVSDYEIINPSIEIKQKDIINGYSLSLFGDYVKNLDNRVLKDDRTAYAFGLGFGDDKIAGLKTWNIRAMYRKLEAAAAPLGLGDSDAYGGAAAKGFEAVLTAGLLKNLDFGFDYYNMTDIDGNNRKQVYQLDFNYKF